MRRRTRSTRPATWAVAALFSLALAQADGRREYVDAAGRFRFFYPASFGEPSPGTNDGFGDRVSAIRFSALTGLGGEAVLTRGFPVVDLQAVGGLYDAIALEVFPDAARRAVLQTLEPLNVSNFCRQLALEQHLDPGADALAGLSDQQQGAVAAVDRMRNVNPRVVRCDVSGTIVTFDKEVSFQAGSPRQHVYGAVRFLDGLYSTFQIVRAGPAPSDVTLDAMAATVRSWRQN